MEEVIRFEKDTSSSKSIPDRLTSIYAKVELGRIEVERQQENALRDSACSRSMSCVGRIPLSDLVNRGADDFITLWRCRVWITHRQRMKNNFVYGLSNPALLQAQEGVVELHLPAVDMTAMLREVDREYVKQHPGMKGMLEEERERVAKENRKRERGRVAAESGCDGSRVNSCEIANTKSGDDSNTKNCDNTNTKSRDTPLNAHQQDSSSVTTQPAENRKKPKLRITASSFLNVNTPLQDEVREEKKDYAVHITDLEIEKGRMSEEELSSLPQMRNVG